MDRVYIYMAGIAAAVVVITYFVISTVRSMNPPAY